MLNQDQETQEGQAPELQDNDAQNSEIENLAPEQNHDDNENENAEGINPDETSEPMPEYMKQHFRRLEKKIKRENRELSDQLTLTKQQLGAYDELFKATYANAYGADVSNEQPKDEVEQKVLTILQEKERKRTEAERAHVWQQQTAKLVGDLKQSLDSAADKYDDFEESVLDNNVPIPPGVAQAAAFVPNAGDALYALTKNPAEFARIRQMTDMNQQAKAFNHFAFNLHKQGGVNAVSKAPKPVGSGAIKDKPQIITSPEDMNYQQLKEYLRSKNRKR